MTQPENQDTIKHFFVRGFDILNFDILPGTVLVFYQEKHSNSYIDKLNEDIVKTLRWPSRYSSLAITKDNWERDVSFHSTKKSQPGTCARIPIFFSLGHHVSNTERYLIRSYEYDPLVHVGDGIIRTLAESLGLENKVHGLIISAHNKDGLLEACKWISSESGKSNIAHENFQSRIAPATGKFDTRRDSQQSEWGNYIGLSVMFKGMQMLCVKQNEGQLCLLNKKTGQNIWRDLKDLDLPNLHQ